MNKTSVPQNEFGFARDTFNLFAATGPDMQRIAREREQAEKDRQAAADKQSTLPATDARPGVAVPAKPFTFPAAAYEYRVQHVIIGRPGHVSLRGQGYFYQPS